MAPLPRALPLALTLGVALAASGKRGLVADDCPTGGCNTPSLFKSVSWFYDYNYPTPYGTNDLGAFVPMAFCLDAVNKTIPPGTNVSIVHGYNEPNNAHNCNTDADTVAKSWAGFRARFPTSTLVSPATAGNGTSFFDAFFAACATYYGTGGCNITYTAVHWYGCTPSETMDYLHDIYKRYGNPVILSEFSCGDGAEGRPTADQVTYMKAIIPLLDAAPFVFRYSWMSAHDKKGLRGLVDNGKLTALGELYDSL